MCGCRPPIPQLRDEGFPAKQLGHPIHVKWMSMQHLCPFKIEKLTLERERNDGTTFSKSYLLSPKFPALDNQF